MPFRSGGPGAVMGANGKRMYSYGTKLAAVRDAVDRGTGPARVMARYGIAGRSPAGRWCGDYRTGGPGALRAGPRGRAKGSRLKARPECAGDQAPRGQAGCLRAKVAHPGKLRGLRARRTSRTGGKAEWWPCLRGGTGRPIRRRPRGRRDQRTSMSGRIRHVRPDRILDRRPIRSGVARRTAAGTADPHGPYPRVRHAGVRQERGSWSCAAWDCYAGYEPGTRGGITAHTRATAAGTCITCRNATSRLASRSRSSALTPPGFRVAGGKAYLAPIHDMGSQGDRRLGYLAAPRSGAAATAPSHA